MKSNLKITLLSFTAISLTGSLVFAATMQDPATEAYVNAQDIEVEKVILARGGTISPSADTCRKSGYGAGTPASIAYVNECDIELYEAIETIPTISPFSLGETLCGNTHPYTCTTSDTTPWGIVIYIDPNPSASGFYGLAMSVADLITGTNQSSSNTGTPWGALVQIDADNYGFYGGINGTYQNYQGQATDGNTKIFCNSSGNDCNVSTDPGTTSAFNACVKYSDGPSLAGGWYLPAIVELAAMFTYAQTQPLPAATGIETFNSYWYWSSTEYIGATNAGSLGNLGFSPTAGNPDPIHQAFYFGFVDGTQDHDNKGSIAEGVRCVQALPI